MDVTAAVGCLLVLAWAAALTVIDLRRRRLPNVLTVAGGLLFVAGAALCGRPVPALLGAAALGGLYLAVHLVDPAALGGGDVKLAAALGALTGALGTPVWILAALGAPLLTAAAAVVVMVLRRGGPATPLPHGPSMCVATLAAAALAVL